MSHTDQVLNVTNADADVVMDDTVSQPEEFDIEQFLGIDSRDSVGNAQHTSNEYPVHSPVLYAAPQHPAGPYAQGHAEYSAHHFAYPSQHQIVCHPYAASSTVHLPRNEYHTYPSPGHHLPPNEYYPYPGYDLYGPHGPQPPQHTYSLPLSAQAHPISQFGQKHNTHMVAPTNVQQGGTQLSPQFLATTMATTTPANVSGSQPGPHATNTVGIQLSFVNETLNSATLTSEKTKGSDASSLKYYVEMGWVNWHQVLILTRNYAYEDLVDDILVIPTDAWIRELIRAAINEYCKTPEKQVEEG